MTGITLLIERTKDGKLNIKSVLVDDGATEIEKRFLGCFSAALQACALQVSGHYKGQETLSYDDVSQRAAEVFQDAVQQLRQSGKSPFED